MNKLTAEERRRIHLAQQAARKAMMDRAAEQHVEAPSGPRGRRRLVGAAILATLIGTGLLAYQVLEFHVPTSIESLLPRL
jgi:hypothetical protein